MQGPVSAPWRRAGWSMAAGAAFDLAFAVAILFFTQPAARRLGLEVPADPVYLRLVGVLLAILAGLYSLAWKSPVRYQGMFPVAATGRFVGFLYLAGVWRGGGAAAFLGVALADLGFCLLHAVLWLQARHDDPKAMTERPGA